MMFSFGLFATHTPYIVLAALYACFLGSWLISSLFPQLPADIQATQFYPVVIEHTTTAWANHQQISDDGKYYFHFPSQALCSLENNNTVPPKCPVQNISSFLQQNYSLIWTGQLYNRPPPL